MDINLLKKIGLIIEWKGSLWEIKHFEHTRRPGRGGAFVKTKLKNVLTGETISKSFIEADNFKIVELEKIRAKYLYQTGDSFVFMSLENYEEIIVPSRIIEGKEQFLKQGLEVQILYYQDEPASILLPPKVKFKVVQSPEAVRGDTSTTPLKQVVLETGLKINVPIFIKQGDTILVNTQTGEYIERAV